MEAPQTCLQGALESECLTAAVYVHPTLPYVSAGCHMAPQTEGCLYQCGGGACDPMATGGMPPESRFSLLSGSDLIMLF
jgi:hypothetical protein